MYSHILDFLSSLYIVRNPKQLRPETLEKAKSQSHKSEHCEGPVTIWSLFNSRKDTWKTRETLAHRVKLSSSRFQTCYFRTQLCLLPLFLSPHRSTLVHLSLPGWRMDIVFLKICWEENSLHHILQGNQAIQLRILDIHRKITINNGYIQLWDQWVCCVIPSTKPLASFYLCFVYKMILKLGTTSKSPGFSL